MIFKLDVESISNATIIKFFYSMFNLLKFVGGILGHSEHLTGWG